MGVAGHHVKKLFMSLMIEREREDECVPALVHWYLSAPPREWQQSTDNEVKRVSNYIEPTIRTIQVIYIVLQLPSSKRYSNA